MVVDWPHRYLTAEHEAGRIDPRTVVTVLTHDPKFDVPLLEVALRLPEVAYVGAMGSRRTHDDRLARLREAGLAEEALGRLSCPIGLDLGRADPGGDGDQHRGRDHRRPLGRLRAAARRHRRPDPRRHEPAGLVIRHQVCAVSPPSSSFWCWRPAARRTRPDPPDASRLTPGYRPTETSTGSTERRSGRPPKARRPTPTEEPLPEVHHPLSLPALMREAPSGGKTRILRTEFETADYTRYTSPTAATTSPSPACWSGRGRGPFPAIVLNHGYIEPSIYVTGQGLAREQDALARAGFVVLHTDYRGHAASDPVPPVDRETRLGYTRDAVNAVDALKKLPYVDDERLAMLGRSMGGGVTMNALVTQPGLVDAAVIYASVSSRFLDNLNHFTRDGRPEVVETCSSSSARPQEAPRFYRELSPRTYFDRITEPVLAHHGTADGTCPPPWARTTQRLMRRGRRGQPAELVAGRGPRVLRALAGLDGPDDPVPAGQLLG